MCLALIQCLQNRSEERGPRVFKISGMDLSAAVEREAQYRSANLSGTFLASP